MIKINWLRLLVCMLVTEVISLTVVAYFGIPTRLAFVAGLCVLVSLICIRWVPQPK